MDAAHDLEGWRPIVTAPKDRTAVLIAGGTVECSTSMAGPRTFQGVTVATYSHIDDEWQGENAGGHDEYYWHQPTHWQPLPDPPRSIPRGE
jgi:hypothetical protein